MSINIEVNKIEDVNYEHCNLDNNSSFDLDDISSLKDMNNEKQKIINDIKKTYQSLDQIEKGIRDKIDYKKDALQTLENEYSRIIDTYSQIVKELMGN